MTGTNARPNGHGVTVRPAKFADLKGMARCHRACFPDQFISRMGTRFAAAFYREYLDHPHGIAFVALCGETNEVIGLVVGGDPGIRAEFLRSAKRRFPFRLALRSVCDPVVRGRVLGALGGRLGGGRHDPLEQETADWPAPEGRWAMLQVICVAAANRGSGAAGRLMDRFGQACRQAGYPVMDLGVRTDNARAIAFYHKCGWREVKQAGGTTYMRRDIDAGPNAGDPLP